MNDIKYRGVIRISPEWEKLFKERKQTHKVRMIEAQKDLFLVVKEVSTKLGLDLVNVPVKKVPVLKSKKRGLYWIDK